MKNVNVALGDRSYPILIGYNLLETIDLNQYVSGNQVLIVTNETIAPLYLDKVKSRFNCEPDTLILPDGERYKTLETLNLIFDRLLSLRHNRTTTLIALGGGVIGDMTGFAAASYQRGVDFIQIPTTLLAQVDSSVGGKTAVNHALGKNMIGAFYQPKAVIADIETLQTLPERELRAGLAEVIKYGLIVDSKFFEWLEDNIEKLLFKDPLALEYAVERSCISKARVVSADERESGMRAILNLGHTFGHAIETYQAYSGWLHGEAVAAGMAMAADLSVRIGSISKNELTRIEHLLVKCELPIKAPEGMLVESFVNLMAVDKKVTNSTLKLVLLEAIGKAFISTTFNKALMMETLNSRASAK